MKSIFAVFAFFAGLQAASATSPAPEMSCLDVQSFQQSDDGSGSFVPTSVSVVIVKSTQGQYGYTALLTDGQSNKQVEVKDVKIASFAADKVTQAKEMAEIMLPNVKWSDVQTVRVGNVGVKANQDDAAGVMVYELVAKDNSVLGKLVTMGWSFGRCSK